MVIKWNFVGSLQGSKYWSRSDSMLKATKTRSTHEVRSILDKDEKVEHHITKNKIYKHKF